MKKYLVIFCSIGIISSIGILGYLFYAHNKEVNENLRVQQEIENTSREIKESKRDNAIIPYISNKPLMTDKNEIERELRDLTRSETEKYEEIKRQQAEAKQRESDSLQRFNPNQGYYANQLPELNSLSIAPASMSIAPANATYSEQVNIPKITNMYNIAKDLIGTPYVWGGTTPYKGMDCSGFTQYVMRQVGYNIPRVSRDQSKFGRLVSRNELLPGDLLFFDTTNPRDASDIKTPTQEMQYAIQAEDGYRPTNVSHVGIYLGDGVMIHASSGDGIITYADLSSNYYKNRFMNARRIIS